VFDVIASLGIPGAHVEPIEISIPMLLVIHELPNVQIAIAVNLDPFSSFLIMAEMPLIDLSILIDLYPPTVSFLPVDLSKIYFPLTFDQFQFVAIHQHINSQVVLRE